MQKTSMLLVAIVAMTVMGTGLVYAQENTDPEIVFSEFQLVIVGIGALGGLVTAYNGYRKTQNGATPEPFNPTKFLDRVFMAVIVSVPLAVAESANLIQLDLVGAITIFLASLGGSQLVMEIRKRNQKS